MLHLRMYSTPNGTAILDPRFAFFFSFFFILPSCFSQILKEFCRGNLHFQIIYKLVSFQLRQWSISNKIRFYFSPHLTSQNACCVHVDKVSPFHRGKAFEIHNCLINWG